ncbi:MAG: alpha/beta hydrolase [Aquabacterium sp.]|uniref:alpha/beta fold hydrolase n=1 Tax=Aquabacterium sp. TaxID=1872578 RepID=UPI0025BA7011|nr:alpha/beta hydrolase [Aquabacterium sp.]MBI5924658.1 alpha/beta hydrolase [Aquabacterium sp.]
MLQQKVLQLPQGSLRYLDQGQGQPVVFVHGLMVDGQLWQPLVAELGPSWRCILPDWPLGAHALPMHPQADLSVPGMVRLIADFIVALDLHDVILVGNDTGGALAQMVCAQFPERIARLVLTTCDAYEVFPPPAFSYLKWLGYSPMLTWLMTQLMHVVPPLRRLPIAFGDLTDKPLDGKLIERWLRPARTHAGVRRDVCKFLRTLSNDHTLQAGRALRHFGQPALLLWSKQSRHFPARLAERLRCELPNAELIWVDSAGVYVSLEHAGHLSASMVRFMGGGDEGAVQACQV